MRLVFVLAFAGAMVNTGFSSGPEFQRKSFGSFIAYAVTVPPARDIATTRNRPAAPDEASAVVPAVRTAVAVPYPVGEDPMDDSMVKTNRSVLPMPIPEVPIAEVCEALATAAERHDLPVAFFARLIWQESRFRQSVVSPAGAQGVAQFMPRTAAAYGLENPFDPVESLLVSARFLSELRDAFGNLGLAAAAYNGGRTRVRQWLARRSGKLPRETRNYVKIITGHEPKVWTAASEEIDLAASLPQDAPCAGTAGLAHDNGPVTMPIQLSGWAEEAVRKAGRKAGARARGSKTYSLAAASRGKPKDKPQGKMVATTAADSSTQPSREVAAGIARGKAGRAGKSAIFTVAAGNGSAVQSAEQPLETADALPSL